MAQLAIRGHATRGKEVIELLEMLGGKDVGYSGTSSQYYYYIDDYSNIAGTTELPNIKTFVTYTIEKFLEKFPYKVGDKVTLDRFPCEIKGMSWENDDIIYYVKGADFSKGVYSKDKDLQPYKEETMESKPNLLKQLKEYFDNTPRDVLEKEWNELSYLNEIGPTVNEYLECVKKYRQSKYPKTYEECCEIIHSDPNFYIDTHLYSGILGAFYKLIICRNAYWKLYGEQMGLGKPWKPDWDSLSINHEFIKIDKGCFTYSSRVLVFPTEEMRDTFYENFNNLIEECKELL